MFTGVFGKNVAVLATLVTFICNVPLKRKILFHVFRPRFIYQIGSAEKISEGSRQVCTRREPFFRWIELLVGSTAGRTAGAGFFFRLIASTTGRTASGSRSSLYFLVPSKEIRKCHDHYLHIVYSECYFALCIFHCMDFFHPHKYALFYNLGHLLVTFVPFRAFLPSIDRKFFLCPSQMLILEVSCIIMNVTLKINVILKNKCNI